LNVAHLVLDPLFLAREIKKSGTLSRFLKPERKVEAAALKSLLPPKQTNEMHIVVIMSVGK